MARKAFKDILRVAFSGLPGHRVYSVSAQAKCTHFPGDNASFARRHASGGTLVRDFIHDSLYNPEYGYFASTSSVVGTIKEPINFPSLQGRLEYQKLLHNTYKELDVSWLTPVETFQPWYSHAIAEYILRQHMAAVPPGPLQIYELGGGCGTNAVSILNYIKARAPHAYRTMKYTSVEISKELASRQLACVREVHSHKGKFSVELRDAVERPGWGQRDDRRCFVVMLEVLDNLPHDRVQRAGKGAPWMETHVHRLQEESPSGSAASPEERQDSSSGEASRRARWVERLYPVADPYVSACLTAALAEGRSKPLSWWHGLRQLLQPIAPDILWLPTGCYKLLETLHAAQPAMTLIAADFNILPDVQIEGQRAPLVASQRGGCTTDYPTYLIPKGTADIFFPTDFRLLQRLDESCASAGADGIDGDSPVERQSAIISTTEFMEKFANNFLQETRTRSGYNPLLEEYPNSSFYLSVPILPLASQQ